MESELQRILEGSILTDGLGEFIFPNGMLGVEDVLLEEGLMALLQADGQMNTKTPFSSDDFFIAMQLDSSPFANLEGRVYNLIFHTNNLYILCIVIKINNFIKLQNY